MAQLTEEQLKNLQKEAEPIFEHWERKQALELVRQLEKEISPLEITNPALFLKAKKFIVQLKWLAFPLIQNEAELFDLVERHFSEGTELDIDLTDIVTAKLELLFGIGIREFLTQILSSLRSNEQEIGNSPIMIKGATSLVSPTIRNWLLDYIRSVPAKTPSELEEVHYLFDNPNAKNLDEKDKKNLGEVLAFYDTFKFMADELALKEIRRFFPIAPEAPVPLAPLEKPTPPGPTPIPTRPSVPPTRPTMPSPTPPGSIPPKPSAPSGFPRPRISPSQEDIYREPIPEEPKPPIPPKPTPKVEGNIVDLKGFGENR